MVIVWLPVIYIWITFSSTASCVNLPETTNQRSFLDFVTPNVTFEDVIFILYTKDMEPTQLNEFNLNLPDYSKPLVFITHGYMGEVNNSWLVEMAQTIVDTKNVNVITVDWKEVANKFYTASVEGSKGVGKVVGQFLAYLFQTWKISLEDVHLIGHSLGAHVMGFAGQEIKNATGSSAGRITGLDPAGPLFVGAAPDDRLSEDDADVVVAIHTASGILGILGSVGNVDFFPNGGVPMQPGCDDDFTSACSHERSHKLFLEALRNENAFVSTQCQSYLLYYIGACKENPTVTLGQDFTEEDFGDYFLNTRNSTPYSF